MHRMYYFVDFAGPDGKPIKDQDPDLVTLVTAKFVNISDDTIIFMLVLQLLHTYVYKG